MIERVERELEQIRQLLKEPDAQNLAVVNEKLRHAAEMLGELSTEVAAAGCDSRTRAFFLQLPRQVTAIRALLDAPHKFFAALQEFRAANFGAYERNGELRTLICSSRTLAQL